MNVVRLHPPAPPARLTLTLEIALPGQPTSILYRSGAQAGPGPGDEWRAARGLIAHCISEVEADAKQDAFLASLQSHGDEGDSL